MASEEIALEAKSTVAEHDCNSAGKNKQPGQHFLGLSNLHSYRRDHFYVDFYSIRRTRVGVCGFLLCRILGFVLIFLTTGRSCGYQPTLLATLVSLQPGTNGKDNDNRPSAKRLKT